MGLFVFLQGTETRTFCVGVVHVLHCRGVGMSNVQFEREEKGHSSTSPTLSGVGLVCVPLPSLPLVLFPMLVF